jgi:hypothetical protein
MIGVCDEQERLIKASINSRTRFGLPSFECVLAALKNVRFGSFTTRINHFHKYHYYLWHIFVTPKYNSNIFLTSYYIEKYAV